MITFNIGVQILCF